MIFCSSNGSSTRMFVHRSVVSQVVLLSYRGRLTGRATVYSECIVCGPDRTEVQVSTDLQTTSRADFLVWDDEFGGSRVATIDDWVEAVSAASRAVPCEKCGKPVSPLHVEDGHALCGFHTARQAVRK